MNAYFNLVYNRIYDFTTGANAAYHHQQENCIDKLELGDNDRLLCIGAGTGNELKRILDRAKNIEITAIDRSITAIRKAEAKIPSVTARPELLLMDARDLKFPDASFDKVLCIHVMDFIQEKDKAIGEIFRVLRNGGRFVITYPARIEGISLGLSLLTSNIRNTAHSPLKRFFITLEYIGRTMVGLLYLPLLLRPKKKAYVRDELEQMYGNLTEGNFHIEYDTAYQDFIVYGDKYEGDETSNA